MSTYDNIVSRLKNNSNLAEGSFALDNAAAVAAEIDEIVETKINYMPNRFFPLLAIGNDLTNSANNFGVMRFPAKSATVLLTITGDVGAIIDSSISVAAGSIIFRIKETRTIPESGSIDVLAEAIEPGAEANLPKGTINEFASAFAGLDSVSNNSASSGGADVESDMHLKERLTLKWGKPTGAGNRYDYIRWALLCPGVARADAYSHVRGEATVYIVGENDDTTPELIANAAGVIKNY